MKKLCMQRICVKKAKDKHSRDGKDEVTKESRKETFKNIPRTSPDKLGATGSHKVEQGEKRTDVGSGQRGDYNKASQPLRDLGAIEVESTIKTIRLVENKGWGHKTEIARRGAGQTTSEVM